MLKKELEAKIASLTEELNGAQSTNDHQSRVDKHIREQFAIAFGWTKPQETFYATANKETKIKNWEQIFIEVGRLLAGQYNEKINDTVQNMKHDIQNIESDLIDIKNN